jgi:hypothetical protein
MKIKNLFSLLLIFGFFSLTFAGEPAKSFLNTNLRTGMTLVNCNENSGTVAYDVSGMKNNGTLKNGATFVAGKNGTAIAGGASGSNWYTEFSASIFNPTNTTPFFVSVIIQKPLNWTIPTAVDIIFQKGNWGLPTSRIVTGIGFNVGYDKFELDVFATGDTTGVNSWNSSKFSYKKLKDGQPHAYGVWYDGLNTATSWRIYFDGEEDKNLVLIAGNGILEVGDLSNVNTLKVGGANSATNEYKNGYYDTIVIETGTLTTAECIQIQRIQLGRHNVNKNSGN